MAEPLSAEELAEIEREAKDAIRWIRRVRIRPEIILRLIAMARREPAEPAWTPGPPTEPGEWELTWRWPATGIVEVRRMAVHSRPSGPFERRLWCDPLDDDPQQPTRTYGSLHFLSPCILAHAPLLRREPYRGET